MTSLTIDFETRGTADLKKTGAWRYAEDANTSVICLAVKRDDEVPRVWLPGWAVDILGVNRLYKICVPGGRAEPLVARELKEILAQADTIEAHNMGFEQAMWFHQMHKKYDFDDLPLEKCRDSAAKAAMHAIPRSLEKAAEAIGLPFNKDMEGHRLMRKTCKPRTLSKVELEEIAEYHELPLAKTKAWYATQKAEGFPRGELKQTDISVYALNTFLRWHEEPEQIERLIEYCIQDLEVEHALSQVLEDLNPTEQKVWELDQKINRRGLPVDERAVRAIISGLEEAEELALEKMAGTILEDSAYVFQEDEIRFEKLKSPRQAALFKDWVNSQLTEGEPIDNVQAGTIEKLLERDALPSVVREVLKIRQTLSKSSTAKYKTLLNKLCEDGTIKDCFMYHGSRTGRFAGRGFQPQNLPRAGYSPRNAEYLIGMLKDGEISVESCEVMGDSFFFMASKLIRPMICAPTEDTDIICADYSSVEARGLAWLAKDEKLLQAFRDGQDVYKIAAGDIYEKAPEDVTKSERQVGKVVVLACGYQGFVGAFAQMAKGYGLIMEEERAKEVITAWRTKNFKIVNFWGAVERAAFEAVEHPGIVSELDVGSGEWLEFFRWGDFFTIQLPSKRKLYYYDPHFRTVDTPWGQRKEVLCYWGVSSTKEKVLEGKPVWGCLSTYGGKLVENITQALCRDLLVEGMLAVEERGYPIVLHAHDEAVAVVKKDFGSLEEFCKILSKLPSWATGFPLAAEGWRGKRYRK